MVVENDGSQASLAVALVRKWVTQDQANFIIGPGGTSDAAAAIPVADAMHVVMEEATSGWHALGLSKSDLQSYGFPSIDNVFLLDDLDTVTKLIVPRHYTRVAVIQESDPGGRLNSTYMQAFGKQDHFKVVAVQTVTPGSTDDTPQVLNLLAAKPQIIVLGMAPGPDTITVLKAVRAQNPDIPTNTLGIQWARTPANHSGMTSVVDVMGTFNEAGQFQLYGGATKVSISKATAKES